MTAQQYRPMAGEIINVSIANAISMAYETGEPVEFRFNDVYLIVNEESDPQEIAKHFHETMRLGGKAYNTPRRRREEQERREDQQNALDALMVELDILNAKDPLDATRWLCRLEELGGNTYSVYDRDKVLRVFAQAGWEPNAEVKREGETSEEWRERVGMEGERRWLIGQALDCIRSVGCPHQMIHHFAKDLDNGGGTVL